MKLLRMLMIVVLVVSTLPLGAGEAAAHGSPCTAVANISFPKGDPKATGSMSCPTLHWSMDLWVRLWKYSDSLGKWVVASDNHKARNYVYSVKASVKKDGCKSGTWWYADTYGYARSGNSDPDPHYPKDFSDPKQCP